MTLRKHSFREWLPVLIWAALALALALFRVPYGVDFTDESYLVTQPYLVTQGQVPWLEMQESTPIVWLLTAPLVSVYIGITGGTAGLFLFMAYMAVLFRAVVVICIWLLLHRDMDPLLAAAFSLALFFLSVPRQLGYVMISMYLLVLAAVLLYTAIFQKSPSGAAWRAALAGVCMAFCAVAHPTQIINCVFLAAVLLFFGRRSWRHLPLWLIYSASGILIALRFTAWLEKAHSGHLFANLIRILNNDPVRKLGEGITLTDKILGTLQRHGLLFLIPLGLCAAALLLLLYLKYPKRRGTMLRLLIWGCLGGSCLALLLTCLIWGNMRSTDMAVIVLFFTVPCYFPAMEPENRRRAVWLLVFFWLTSLVSMLVILLATPSTIGSRIYTLYPGALLAIPFSAWAVSGCVKPGRARLAFSVLPFVMGVLFCVSALVNTYTNIYRDEPISELTYQVESGVYRGCRTTPGRGKGVEATEETIRQVTKPGESVLFLDRFSIGYMMAEAEARTPSSWDPLRYGDGVQSADRLLNYFEEFGEPDKIIYVKDQLADKISMDDPENEFAAYVRANYTLTDAFEDIGLPMYVYTRAEGRQP